MITAIIQNLTLLIKKKMLKKIIILIFMLFLSLSGEAEDAVYQNLTIIKEKIKNKENAEEILKDINLLMQQETIYQNNKDVFLILTAIKKNLKIIPADRNTSLYFLDKILLKLKEGNLPQTRAALLESIENVSNLLKEDGDNLTLINSIYQLRKAYFEHLRELINGANKKALKQSSFIILTKEESLPLFIDKSLNLMDILENLELKEKVKNIFNKISPMLKSVAEAKIKIISTEQINQIEGFAAEALRIEEKTNIKFSFAQIREDFEGTKARILFMLNDVLKLLSIFENETLSLSIRQEDLKTYRLEEIKAYINKAKTAANSSKLNEAIENINKAKEILYKEKNYILAKITVKILGEDYNNFIPFNFSDITYKMENYEQYIGINIPSNEEIKKAQDILREITQNAAKFEENLPAKEYLNNLY